MEVPCEVPAVVCRSSVQHCGSFHGRKLHPGQTQPETGLPSGDLLSVPDRAPRRGAALPAEGGAGTVLGGCSGGCCGRIGVGVRVERGGWRREGGAGRAC